MARDIASGARSLVATASATQAACLRERLRERHGDA